MASLPQQLKNEPTIRAIVGALGSELGYAGTIENNNELATFGGWVMSYGERYNSFLSNLVNRIGLTIIQNRYYYNHYSQLKQGTLDIGETVQEIFVNLCDVSPYNIDRAEKEVFKRVEPDVLASYYSINIETFYKQTLQRTNIRKAFVSFTAFENMLRGIINSMYISLAYDEECLTKYLVQKNILNGFIRNEGILAPSKETASQIMTTIQEKSLQFTFMRSGYNFAGVPNFAPIDEQMLYISTELESLLGVEVLATSFNMDLADYRTRRILFDDFWNNDIDRLRKIFKDNADWEYFSAEEINFLKTVKAVATSQNLTKIYDTYLYFDWIKNPEGMYENYFLHSGKVYALSPFENACAFTTSPANATKIEVVPSTATMQVGTTQILTAQITPAYADNRLNWVVNTTDSATGTASVYSTVINGVLNVGSEETATKLYVYAISADGTVSGKCTVTITA